ncbi:MAG TPA: glycosyltransferase family 2 protein [Gemmatimonadaceae bacterium]|nr:glycosyltransferase family 2 protein [Gemmatimonadaceae bacterium]
MARESDVDTAPAMTAAPTLSEERGVRAPASAAHETRPVGERPTVCMINYNGEAYLERSLSALTAQMSSLAEIVMVDNGSTDGSRALVEARFPHVRLVAMPRNLGAAAARNVAIAEARTDLILLIDNDVTLARGALHALHEALRAHPDAVMAMPAILHGPAPDGATVQYDGAETHFLGQQTLHHQEEPYPTVPRATRAIGSLVSACLLLDRARLPRGENGATDALATFDEDFFIYFEDHDFGHRMRALGLGVLAVPAAFCHHGAGTQGVSIRALGTYSSLRVYSHIRNRWIFLLKNYELRSLLLLAPVLAMYEAVQLAAVAKKGWLREWWRSAWWMATHARAVHRKRRVIQRHRRTPDRELLRGGPVPLRAEATVSAAERAARRVLDASAGWYWRVVRRAL